MLTPQEVSDQRFKQAFVGGYDMTAVDEFLEKLTEDYTRLYKENAVLKNKMKVLVDKLEEYRSNEESIRQAYVAIHAQAEKELETARKEREDILNEARAEADEMTGSLHELVAKEEKRLRVTREQTATFIGTLKDCYNKQIEQLNLILTASMEDSPRQKHDNAVRETAAEIDASVSALVEADMPDPQPAAPDPLPEAPQSRPIMAEPRSVISESGEDEVKTFTPGARLETKPPLAALTPNQEPVAAKADAVSIGEDIDIFERAVQNAAGITLENDDGDFTGFDGDDAPTKILSEDLVYSVEESMTATFNENEEVDWTPDEISEIQRPAFDFSTLPENFGHDKRKFGIKGKKR